MLALRDADLDGTSRTFDSEGLADQLEDQRKKRRYAYLAWLCLGSHYLYLGRPAIQALFWLTGGGLLIWWLADFLRMPGLVARRNRRQAEALLKSWQLQFGRPVEPLPLAPQWTAQPSEPAAPAPYAPLPEPRPPLPFGRAAERRIPAKAAAAALLVLVMTVGGLYVSAQRPVYPRAVFEPSYRTARQVNVREAPSTRSAIRGVVEKNILLRGTVEEVTDASPSIWLHVTRGPHAGRYVALQNLDRR